MSESGDLQLNLKSFELDLIPEAVSALSTEDTSLLRFLGTFVVNLKPN